MNFHAFFFLIYRDVTAVDFLNYILMYFLAKNTLKSNRYHITKHILLILKEMTFLSWINYKITLILYVYTR